MPPVVFEPTISEGERPQTYALDGAATGTGCLEIILLQNTSEVFGFQCRVLQKRKY